MRTHKELRTAPHTLLALITTCSLEVEKLPQASWTQTERLGIQPPLLLPDPSQPKVLRASASCPLWSLGPGMAKRVGSPLLCLMGLKRLHEVASWTFKIINSEKPKHDEELAFAGGNTCLLAFYPEGFLGALLVKARC